MLVLIISIILVIIFITALIVLYNKEVEYDKKEMYREVERLSQYSNTESKIDETIEKTKIKVKKVFKKYLKMLPLIVVAFIPLLIGSITQVGPNQVGIVYDPLNGGIQEYTMDQGLHFKSPFKKIIKIKTSNVIKHIETDSQSQDGNSVTYNITLTFNIDTSNAGKFYKKANSKILTEEHLNTLVKEGIQRISSQYEVFDIIGSKVEDIRSSIFTEVKNKLMEQYYVTLQALTIEDVDAGDDIEKALERKAEEKLQREVAEAEKVRAEIEADTALIRANNEAEIILLKANANAEAQAVLNSVAVNAIQTMYELQFKDEDSKNSFELNGIGGYLTIQEIGDIVIKQLYYDIWDGKLPSVITDSNGNILIQP